MRASIAGLALSLVICTGCGGSGEAYSADATAACLSRAGAVIDKGPAPVAGAGSNEALRVLLGRHEVVVVFHRSASDAKQTKRLFEMLDNASGRNSELLSRSRNAVVFWNERAPTADERATVIGCLRSS